MTITDKFNDFVCSLDSIKDPEKKGKDLIDILRYVVPSLQSISIDDDSKKNITIEDKLIKLSEENQN